MDTLFESIRSYPELRIVRNELFPKIFTRKFTYDYRLKSKSLTRGQPPLQNEWFVPVWKTDQSVVKRTQMMNYADNPKDTPVLFEQYLSIFFQPWYMYLGVMFMYPITKLLLRFKATRHLVQDFPDFFTCGFFTKVRLTKMRSFSSGLTICLIFPCFVKMSSVFFQNAIFPHLPTQNGPTLKQVKATSFDMYMVGSGWKADQPAMGRPLQKATLNIQGPEIGYAATSRLVLLSAITILEDLEPRTDLEGGVYTPGIAFRNTKLIERLCRNGFKFRML